MSDRCTLAVGEARRQKKDREYSPFFLSFTRLVEAPKQFFSFLLLSEAPKMGRQGRRVFLVRFMTTAGVAKDTLQRVKDLTRLKRALLFLFDVCVATLDTLFRFCSGEIRIFVCRSVAFEFAK